jgi:hypothetical protein
MEETFSDSYDVTIIGAGPVGLGQGCGSTAVQAYRSSSLSLRSRLIRLEGKQRNRGRCAVCRNRLGSITKTYRQYSPEGPAIPDETEGDSGEPCAACGCTPSVIEVIEAVVRSREDLARDYRDDSLSLGCHYIGRSPVIDLTGTPVIALYFALLGARLGDKCVVYSVNRSVSAPKTSYSPI